MSLAISRQPMLGSDRFFLVNDWRRVPHLDLIILIVHNRWSGSAELGEITRKSMKIALPIYKSIPRAFRRLSSTCCKQSADIGIDAKGANARTRPYNCRVHSANDKDLVACGKLIIFQLSKSPHFRKRPKTFISRFRPPFTYTSS